MLPWRPMDRRWLLGGVLLASGFGFVRAMTYRPKLDADSRLLVIGDSMAQGMLPHFRVFASEMRIPFMGGGIPGTRVDQWDNSEWLKAKLVEFKPTHVLVVLETNDAVSQLDPEVVKTSAIRLVTRIESAGAHAIWIGAPELPPSLKVNIQTLEAIRSAAPYYFDSTECSIPRAPDNLHPSVKGYTGWAGAIWNWLT